MTTEEIANALEGALALMNDSGAHWTQRVSRRFDEDTGEISYCSVGAIRKLTTDDPYSDNEFSQAVIVALGSVLPPIGESAADERPDSWAENRVVSWNDDQTRTWDEIVAKFAEAKEKVLSA